MDIPMSYISLWILPINSIITVFRWPQKTDKQLLNWRAYAESLDSLLASIMCPLAVDLYFAMDWLSGCDADYTLILLVVTLILYACGVAACYSLAGMTLSDHFSHHDDHHQHHQRDGLPDFGQLCDASFNQAFCFSAASNFLLTWLLLPLTSWLLDLGEAYDQDVCYPLFLTSMMKWVAIGTSLGFLIYIMVYSSICLFALQEKRDKLRQSKTFFKQNVHSMVFYTVAALFCLFATVLIKMLLTTCSCKSLFFLERCLPWVTLLLGLKLPVVACLRHFCPAASIDGKFQS